MTARARVLFVNCVCVQGGSVLNVGFVGGNECFSLQPAGNPVCGSGVEADVTGDGLTTIQDVIAIVAVASGSDTFADPCLNDVADLNNDGLVVRLETHTHTHIYTGKEKYTTDGWVDEPLFKLFLL